MGRKACLNIGANNYGFDNNGNYQEDAFINMPEWCTYDDPMDADEETLAEDIGSEDFTTHQEAEERVSGNKNTNWAINRRTVEEEARIEELKKVLPVVGIGLLALFGGVL